ncbi:MAG: sugar phosphate isomerase/epimerase [Clostridia bacterium]|nr:sugar phosphate isomerase/epimerase [Clostridia bacterium]
MKFAVQVYSVRDCIHSTEEFFEVLGKIKALGFDGVEFAGFHGASAEALKARLDELGLVPVGAHLGLDDWREDKLESTRAYLRTIGAKAAGIGGCKTDTEESLKDMMSVLGAAYKRAAEEGITVYFHTHTGEFVPTEDSPDDRTQIERIAEVCATQIDTYWSFVAGIDTCAYLREHRDRIPFIHIKDGIGGTPKALGEGENELENIAATVSELGYEWVILENDDPVPDGLSDIARSMKWLREHF